MGEMGWGGGAVGVGGKLKSEGEKVLSHSVVSDSL